jgi:hypothetical protein
VKDSGLGGVAEAREGAPTGAAWRAMFTENGLWASLFTALLWRELTGDCGGAPAAALAWKHPWQSAPLDAGEDSAGWWAAARRRAVAAALRRIAAAPRCALAAEAAAAYAAQARAGAALLRNRYDLLTPEDVGEVVHAAGGGVVAAVLRRVAADPFGHSIGFPDVTLWRAPECCAPGSAAPPPRPPPHPPPQPREAPTFAMVEVKSERDRMQPSQIAWFKELQGVRGANICVLRVVPVAPPA